eukprot:2360866-Pleurochrysis_carterae.AAC.2
MVDDFFHGVGLTGYAPIASDMQNTVSILPEIAPTPCLGSCLVLWIKILHVPAANYGKRTVAEPHLARIGRCAFWPAACIASLCSESLSV